VKFSRLFLFLCFQLICAKSSLYAQWTNLRRIKLGPEVQTRTLDSLTIYPNSFRASSGGKLLTSEDYQLNYVSNKFELLHSFSDSIILEFRVLPFNLGVGKAGKDTSIIYRSYKGDFDKFKLGADENYTTLFQKSGLEKKGSISRGISFGNAQNLAVNSSLNLELSGEIGENLKIMASVTDKNIPLQPEGTTNKLQEFDQIYIQLYNDQMKLIAGDFWANKPKGYFITYQKRGQGLMFEKDWTIKKDWKLKTASGVGLSRGKYMRQVIQGIEGNQGPYRLIGNENERFIFVLSGTEKVYLDGVLMQRGQDFDYVINYNTAEVTFTTRRTITKDLRIVVEFQYSDQNYARLLALQNIELSTSKSQLWFNLYREQDAKNQPLQQTLTREQINKLSSVGDSLTLAYTPSVDSIGFIETQNLYAKIDTLQYTGIMVHSVQPNKAIYQVNFSFVGANKGNYRLKNYNALGKVYEWVAPINNEPQGDYEPLRILISPKLKQVMSIGGNLIVNEHTQVETELAHSLNDVNTFSTKDAANDLGWSSKTTLKQHYKLGKQENTPWTLKNEIGVEYLSEYFTPVEVYRSMEFDRDWNTRDKKYTGNQVNTNFTTSVQNEKNGTIQGTLSHFKIGSDYLGYKIGSIGNWNYRQTKLDYSVSQLNSEHPQLTNSFLRHKLILSQGINKIRVGFQDEHERNLYQQNNQLQKTSYSFYDYQGFVTNNDSSAYTYKIFYRERLDRRSDSIALTEVAKAKQTGLEYSILTKSNQRFNFLVNYRQLEIYNRNLIQQTPENSLLGRIDYDLNLLKGAVTWNSFYELGSGLELKKEFIYIKVNDGQGIYTWIDYNKDGIKDLNEFEIAKYSDQASYIRVFTPSSSYVKTFSNELNQGVFIKLEKLWNGSSNKLLAGMARFSNQTRMRIQRKTNRFEKDNFYNPFDKTLQDTNLISTGYNLRNTLFFNRLGSIFGADYTFQENTNKSLLATGFDARGEQLHEVTIRINFLRYYYFENVLQQGSKSAQADYTIGRNYSLNYAFVKPTFSFQPSTNFRWSIEGRYGEKTTTSDEYAKIIEITSRVKYNELERGSLQLSLSALSIQFQGTENSAVGFELLEALKPGQNYTWNLNYQRNLSKKLQLSINYSGRKSVENKAIHTGGMELRAFF